MRIAVGSLMQETNTFVPFRTTVDTFNAYYLRRDAELLTGFGSARVEIPGFLSVLAEAGATPVPLLAGHGGSNGPVMRETFDVLVSEMVHRLAARRPVDGVLLALHGAMVVEDEPDAEAEILERVRNVLPPGTPIGVSLDLHGHITPRMLQPDVFFVGYREYPHIDMFETGERTARLLLDVLAGRRRPVMALAKRPMLVSPVNARTAEAPLSAIVAEARRLEADGAVLHASLFPVQPWIDVPDLGFAALACADNDVAAAQAAADRLADMAWAARAQFDPDLVPLQEAIRIGLASEGTTVVGDGGDAPSGGAAGDNAGVLRALLAAGADRAGRLSYLTLCDAMAAKQAASAGVGATVTLHVGHRQTRDGEPVEITGVVRALTDGVYTMHDAGAQGSEAHLGLTAVLAIGDIRLALRSLPGMEWDTGLFTSVGLVLPHAALVFVKSPAHFRVAFGPHAARVLTADTAGATCGNMRRLVFRNVTRPLYPLDDA
ncbi:MAG: M81 family metallopeptidase [Acetobacteraceae bacterium]|nr:M81 family metallopeptidase [Acetobacteraceae bacterium]